MAQPQLADPRPTMMRVACVALTTINGASRRQECGNVFTTPKSNVPCPRCGARGKTIAWPTVDQLDAMGLIRCEHEAGCSIYVDPENMPSRRCISHARTQRREQSQQRRRPPRTPYLPRTSGVAAPTRRDRIAERDAGGRRPRRDRERRR